ncbi:predicted protein [Postia placenta Mad-698-R]|nr:predicted protein [Postia placenta Mad-698-R]
MIEDFPTSDVRADGMREILAQPSEQDQPDIVMEDRLEPADDLLEGEAHNSPEDDPIEDGPTPPPSERQLSVPPSLATPRLGTARSMKDRHGQIAGSQDELPVLASVMFESVPQSTPAPHTSTQPETCPDTVARRTRNATRRSGSTTAMLPPPVPATPALAPPPAPALAPKPRGRQRLTEQEKAKRAAEKKRVMEEKKAEKAALKAAKDAEKAAAKAAKDAEKARKQGEKKKAGGPTKAEAATAAPPNEATSTSVSVAGPDVEASTPSTHGWTVLPVTATPSLMDHGSSVMVDELQPSSPPQSPLAPFSSLVDKTLVPTQDDSLSASPGPSQAGSVPHPAEGLSAAKSSASHSDEVIPDSDPPLFFPSDSQHPTPYIGTQPRRDALSQQSIDHSGSDNEADMTASMPKPHLRSRRYAAAEPYRRLSDIDHQTLFSSQSINNSMSFSLTPAPKPKPKPSGLATRADESESDSDDDEESDDSNAANRSHIPRDRMAGAGVKKKKSGLLASFTK